jgi:8-oxo-dGTP pyrophosphatase MutT (NUDIX family)
MVDDFSQRSLVFPFREDMILLGLKKKDLGEGNYNGFGGKFDSSLDNNILDTAKRELEEESGLVCSLNELEKVAVIDFYFPFKPVLNQRVHVYFFKDVQGEPVETDEMAPEWFSLNKIPYKKMWKSDSIWLKELMLGKKFVADFYWKSDNKTVDRYTLKEVDSF